MPPHTCQPKHYDHYDIGIFVTNNSDMDIFQRNHTKKESMFKL